LSRKYKVIPACLILITAILSACDWNNKTTETIYPPEHLIRLHIVANSDCAVDQALKRKVRDEIIRQISPDFLGAQNIDTAREIARADLSIIKEIASREIMAEGKDYPVDVKLGSFNFPTKHYGPFMLPAGNYESVQVIIGSGSGTNWWCVLFPPLCFVDMPRVTAVDSGMPAPISPSTEEQLPENLAAASETGDTDTALSIDDHVRVEFRFRILDIINNFFS